MRLFGRGRSSRPEVRLRRAVDQAGQPTSRRVDGLLARFGHDAATPEALHDVEVSLERVGLTTDPRLSEVDGDAVIDILVWESVPATPHDRPAEPSPGPDDPTDTRVETARHLREQQDRPEAQLSALREEFQAELAAVRDEAAAERRAREEAEARAAEALAELDVQATQLADAERRIEEAQEQGQTGIRESQEAAHKEREQAASDLREARIERERLEADASEQATRRDEERAEAERRADEAFAMLESGRRDSEPSAQDVDPEHEPMDGARPQQHPNGSGSATEPRVPAFHQPPSKKPSRFSLPKLPRGRKRNRDRAARLTCAVTGVEAPSDSEWELRRHGWIISGSNALSPEAQADGWQYPEGAALPFRKLSER